MLAAGLFEYNFGDSEFLMLFLVLVTLPYAAERAPATPPPRCPMPAAPTDLQRAARSRARPRRRSIVGDLMLDHFVIGRVDRISPEAPVPVVQFDHESYRLGGAANVAHNVAALGGTRRDRRPGRRRRGRRAAASPSCGTSASAPAASSPTASRCTTRKLRVVTTRNQQVARIDYECDRDVDGDARGGAGRRKSATPPRTPTSSWSPTT